MGRLFSWFDTNDNEQVRTGNNSLETFFANTSSLITEEQIMKIPTVQKCMDVICGTIAQLPLYLYRENEDGSIDRVYGDKREFLLNNEPNEFENSYNFKKRIVRNYLLYGVDYIVIERQDNEVVELHNLKNSQVTIETFKKDSYKISNANIRVDGEGNTQVFKPYELAIILKDSSDGLTSKGILSQGLDIFQLIYGETEYSKNIFNNGALPTGILKTDGRLSQSAVDRLRDSWRNLYSGAKNAGKTVILEEGLSYQPISLNPNDMQLTQNRKENISEVCKLFSIPESLVVSSANKYGSLQQDNIHFLQYCLNPILKAIECGIDKGMLLEQEKQEGYFWQFDTSEIVRTTEKDKFETVKVALESGVISINEARRMINLKDINDDIMKWSLGNVLYYPQTGDMKIPNMGMETSREVKQDGKDSTNNIDDV